MFGNNDLESGADSSSEVISPMVTRSTPKQHEKTYNQQQSKILMMSTTDRRTESNATTETSTGRATIATKKVSWEKRCKRFGSLCMAIFLFAGGISLFVSGAVLLSINTESYGTGMIIVGAIMIVPGIYGMHKLVRWVMKHRALRQRYRGTRMSQDLIEEAEEELD